MLWIFYLYLPSFHAYFVSDDYYLWKVVKNLEFKDSFRLLLPQALGGISAVQHTGHHAPLSAWLIWLNTVPLNMQVFQTHLISFSLHLLAVCLLAIFTYQLTQNEKIAFLSGLCFGIFPFISEAVYFMSAILFLTGTVIYLASLVTLLQFIKMRKRFWLVIHVFTFCLAIFSAEITFTLPLAVCLLLYHLEETHFYLVLLKYLKLFLTYFILIAISILHWILSLNSVDIFKLSGRFEANSVSRLFLIYIACILLLLGISWYLRNQISTKLKKKKGLFWTLILLIGITWLPTAKLFTEQRYLYLPVSMATITGVYLFFSLYKTIKEEWIRKFFTFGIFGLLIFQSVVLYQKSLNWLKAGETAHTILIQLADELQKNPSAQLIYLINIPDSLNGVYVHRSYFTEAYELLTGKPSPTFVFTPMTVGIQSQAIIGSPTLLYLVSQQGFVLFKPAQDAMGRRIIEQPNIYRATEIDGRTLEVEFVKSDLDLLQNKIYKFEDGKIQKLLP